MTRAVTIFKPPGDVIKFNLSYKKDIKMVNIITAGNTAPSLLPVPDRTLYDAYWRTNMTRVPLLTGRMTGEAGKNSITTLIAFENDEDARSAAGTALAAASHPEGLSVSGLDIEEARMFGSCMGMPLLLMLDGGDAMFYPPPQVFTKQAGKNV